VVNDRHLRKKPMVFTTNTAAILDRVLERGRLITLDGPSGRTRHLKLDDAAPVGWCSSLG
jgi:hypothetical protein